MLEELLLEKKVKVSDTWRWYDRSSVRVKMWVLHDNSTVRISFLSVDDFIVYQDFNEWDVVANWRWCKEWLFDRIPDTVDCDWLYEHGYRPF
jgi:hypothetical protein